MTFTNDITWVAFRICSICDDRKKPIADIEPQIKKIVESSSGMLLMEVPKKAASTVSTVNAGNPNNSCDNASPVMYVKGETGEATKTSWILYSVL
jgi:hypothetical protein